MLAAAMGSKKPSSPPPPPPPAAIPKTADADASGNAEVLRRRRGSSYAQTFLAGPTLGGASQNIPGGSSFLGGN
jgi:hypothetical protein